MGSRAGAHSGHGVSGDDGESDADGGATDGKKPANSCKGIPGRTQAEKALDYLSPRTVLASDINMAHLNMRMLGDKFELVIYGESAFL